MLAAWIGLSLLAGAASALRYDAPVEVATSGSAPPVEVAHEGWADVDERRLPPPVSTTTTVAATAAPTPAPPAPTAPPPAPTPAVLTVDRPGMWIIRADGSDARFLGDVGGDGWNGYPAHWSPDSSALFGLQSRDGVHLQLVRTGLDGSRRWYDLPPAPATGEDTDPSPRWITELEVSGNRISFGWLSDDGYAGAAVATLDLSRVLTEFEHCCRGRGNRDGTRFAFATGGGIEVFDVSGRRVAGPFDIRQPGDEGAGVGAWSPDGRHLLAGSGERTCVLDVATGACPTVDAGGGLSWMGGGRELLVSVHGSGTTPQSLYAGPPSGPRRLLTSNGSYGVSHPDGSAVVFGRSPYEDQLPGQASVHIVNADGSGERVLARTRNAIAFPASWSPDGQWVAVHIGGPR